MTIVLTERDVRVLEFLKEHDCADRKQLERILSWHCTSRINRRLRKLVDSHVLDRRFIPTTVGAPPAVYFLGTQGIMVLSGESDTELTRLRKQRKRIKGMALNSMPHCLAVTEVASAFKSECEADARCKWFDWKTEEELRKLCNPDGYSISDRLVPDGYGKYSVDEQRFNFFLELDCGTEPLKRIRRKLDFYRSLVDSGAFRRVFGFRRFALLIVTTTKGRSRSLAMRWSSPDNYVLRVGSIEAVTQNPLFGQCWQSPGERISTALHDRAKVRVVRSK